MKALLLLGFIAMALGSAHCNSSGPLDQPVEAEYSFKNFADVLPDIKHRTGLTVKCPAGLAEFMQKIFQPIRSITSPTRDESAAALLDQICDELRLKWHYDPAANIINLDLAWKIQDARSPVELLHYLEQHYPESHGNQIREIAPGLYAEPSEPPNHQSRCLAWQNALDALLSKPENFNQAWRVRQQFLLDNMIWSPGHQEEEGGAPVFFKEVISTDLQHYLLLIMIQPIHMYPGRGSMSSYWFKADGTLAGSDIASTGNRCEFLNADLESASAADGPSEIVFNLEWNTREQFSVRFQLTPDGLKRISPSDKAKAPDLSSGVGDSILKR